MARSLFLGENDVFLGGLGFERLQPFAKRFQIMTEPDAANARRRNEKATLGQFVRHAHLTEGRLLQGHLHDRLLDVVLDPILRTRLAAADLAQRQLAALVV
jgi:hypothetical protein